MSRFAWGYDWERQSHDLWAAKRQSGDWRFRVTLNSLRNVGEISDAIQPLHTDGLSRQIAFSQPGKLSAAIT